MDFQDFHCISDKNSYDIIISTLPEQTIPYETNKKLIKNMLDCLLDKMETVLVRVRYVIRKKMD
jgi:phospholipid N-methyltransferase